MLEAIVDPNTQKAQDATRPFKFPNKRVTEKELEGMGFADGPRPILTNNIEEEISKWLRFPNIK